MLMIPDTASVSLQQGRLRLDFCPGRGAGIARFDYVGPDDTLTPLMRPWRGSQETDPHTLACFPLLPWCNRIGYGRFTFRGKTHSIERNRPSRHPINGSAWQTAWRLEQLQPAAARLTLAESRIGPYVFSATMDLELDDRALHIGFAVSNHGDDALPFGVGLHPWFPRQHGSTITARSNGYWEHDDDCLPLKFIPGAAAMDLDFSTGRPLPATSVSHCFAGWDGRAILGWGRAQKSLELSTDPPLKYFIIYAPASENAFCFEPVSHPIDAHNMEFAPERSGLRVLSPGDILRQRFTFSLLEAVDSEIAAQ